jgi:hypothetical protein
MSKKKKDKKKVRSVSDSAMIREVMAQTTGLIESYTDFAAKIEDYTSAELYEEEYAELKDYEAARIRTAVKKYVQLLVSISKALQERLDG